ncbi:SMP-30/gluconolactonase/LRE family protein [Knoellia koreensis]|uniref:SMP-30/gluconolactonase/LRE family protein n=1 Tax=Knoellia koreensis TaxID=2730921 RepID=A0A849HHI0_9MICO|nr:SMP-30/gluconolactonase/LRE family protein [Knoellia sp. DB2414S]NNM47425.1 SMP-30/gluconolactonase/LRE family protein [Knoellia sp. DB2414S]
MSFEVVGEVRAHLGESPRWDAARQRLVWVDLWGNAIHSTDPTTGVTTTIDTVDPATSVTPTTWGHLATIGDRLYAVSDGEVLAVSEALARPGGRCNDSGVDPRGRVVVGTMAWTAADPGLGDLWSVDPRSGRRLLVADVGLANGIAWSADGATLWLVDTRARTLTAYPHDLESGTVGEPTVVVDVPEGDGVPDGIAIDAADHVWVCLHGGGVVRRYRPDGTAVGDLEVPVAGVTACAFGGPDLDQLFVTTGRGPRVSAGEVDPLTGRVFVAQIGTRGRLVATADWPAPSVRSTP